VQQLAAFTMGGAGSLTGPGALRAHAASALRAATFKAFDFGSGASNEHIVGAACPDCRGFIEDALSSAELTLQAIPARLDAKPESEGQPANPAGSFPGLPLARQQAVDP
jgi:hypothetical protein